MLVCGGTSGGDLIATNNLSVGGDATINNAYVGAWGQIAIIVLFHIVLLTLMVVMLSSNLMVVLPI